MLASAAPGSQLPNLPFVVVNFPSSSVTSTGHTAIPVPCPPKKQKTTSLRGLWHLSIKCCSPDIVYMDL